MDDVRYIILPGDLRNEERLTFGHIRIAMVLGAYSRDRGWTDLTQNDVGEMAGLSRQTVCTLVGELVDWGWVKRRKKAGKNQYVYRFIMDREDCQPEATVVEGGTVSHSGQVMSPLTRHSKEKGSTLSQSSLSAPLPPSPAEQPQSGQDDYSISKKRYRGIIHLKAGDVGWTGWIEHIEAKLGAREAEAAISAGVIDVVTRWPTDDTPLPNVGRVPA